MRRLTGLIAAALVMAVAAPAAASGISDGNAGMAAMKRGDYAEAIRLFTHALGAGGLGGDDRQLAYSERGQAYLQTGQYRLAVTDLDRAVRMHPDDQDAVRALAEARADLGAAGSIPPPASGRRGSSRQAEADANAGMAVISQGNYPEAVTLFSRAIDSGALSPHDAELAYASRARALIQTGEDRRAVGDLTVALRLDPHDQQAGGWLWEALLRLRAVDAEPSIPFAACVANYSSQGNWANGRSYAVWAAYPRTSRVDAIAGAYGFLMRENWKLTSADFTRGELDATEPVLGGKLISVTVKIEPGPTGSRASVTAAAGPLVPTPDMKTFLCRLLAAVPQG